MKTALIQVRADSKNAFHESIERAKLAVRTGKPSDPLATFTFSSTAQLFSVFSPKRWELIQELQKSGPVSMRGLARALQRDIRRVHDDVTVLLDWGIIEKNGDGKIFVPFDVIHTAFDIRAAA